MRWTRWRIVGAVALVGSGVAVAASGAFSGAQAAVGDCTASPTTTTTSSSSTSSTSSTSSSSTSSTSTSTSTTALGGALNVRGVIVTAAGPGGGPHVEVWSPDAADPIASFYAYDPNFHGGVSVAAGDINNDGYDDIVTGAGPGGGPHVKIFSGAPANGKPSLTELGGFMAYDPGFHGGVDVAVGDVDGDGHGDIVTGAGAGGGPHVRIFSGAAALGPTPALTEIGGGHGFYAYGANFVGGVTVAAADMGGPNSHAEIVTGAGPGGGPHVRVFEPDGTAMTGTGGGFMAFPANFAGGVNVAANCTNGVARIAAAPATQANAANIHGPDGTVLDGGFALTPANPSLSGVDVALGTYDPQDTPPIQLVTGFSGAPADPNGDAQVYAVSLPTSREDNPDDAFDAYGAAIKMSVAVGYL